MSKRLKQHGLRDGYLKLEITQSFLWYILEALQNDLAFRLAAFQ